MHGRRQVKAYDPERSFLAAKLLVPIVLLITDAISYGPCLPLGLRTRFFAPPFRFAMRTAPCLFEKSYFVRGFPGSCPNHLITCARDSNPGNNEASEIPISSSSRHKCGMLAL
jgi:hypothetical protein